MSIATEITRLQNAKASIKASIEAKGVSVPSSTTLDGYSTLIDSIPSGGGTTINGQLVNKTIQSGNVAKGDFVSVGTHQIQSRISSDLRYYTNPSYYTLDNINNFYMDDDNYAAQVNTKSGVTSVSYKNIYLAMPTKEQLNIPSGKTITDFSIELLVSWGGLSFDRGQYAKIVNLQYYLNGNIGFDAITYDTKTYTTDDESTFPKTAVFYKPAEVIVTTDNIQNWGVRVYHGTRGYSMLLYNMKYSITYEDDGQIKTVTGTSDHLLGIANENGSQGDTIKVYVPSQEEPYTTDYITDNAIVILDAIKNDGTEHSDDIVEWKDLSNNGNHFNLSNITWNSNGANIIADSSNCYSPVFNQGQNRTVEICCSIDEEFIGGSEQPLLADFDGEGRDQAGNFGLQNASFTNGVGLTYCDQYNSYHDFCILSGNDYVRNQRYTISASINDNGTLKGYINGVKVLEETNQNLLPLTANMQYKAFGRYVNTSNLSGIIHSIRIYNKELTENEVMANYNVDVTNYN